MVIKVGGGTDQDEGHGSRDPDAFPVTVLKGAADCACNPLMLDHVIGIAKVQVIDTMIHGMAEHLYGFAFIYIGGIIMDQGQPHDPET
jgi:hypothetical protein